MGDCSRGAVSHMIDGIRRHIVLMLSVMHSFKIFTHGLPAISEEKLIMG